LEAFRRSFVSMKWDLKGLNEEVAKLQALGWSDEKIISSFIKMPGWFDYSGNYSYQAATRLECGCFLRVGTSDGGQKLWTDKYVGLTIVGGDYCKVHLNGNR
jgi:hypothetical protein